MSVSKNDPNGLRPRLLVNLALSVIVAVLVATLVLTRHGEAAHADERVPQSAAMEATTGVRFTRVAVVGDGGLLTVFYEVVDPEKATAFQSDRDHPPRLASESRAGGTKRVSIMRSGHAMRAGQTYYLVYEDTGGAIRSNEKVSLVYKHVTLRHVPVL